MAIPTKIINFLLNLNIVFDMLARSTHRMVLIHGGNVLFNDALNTFYLRLYGVGHMIKEQSAIEDSYACIIPKRGHDIQRFGLYQLWNIGWNEK